MTEEILDYIQELPIQIRWIIPLLMIAIFLWAPVRAHIAWQRACRRERRLLELSKLRYEIEAIKKQNDFDDLDRTLDVPRLTMLLEREQEAIEATPTAEMTEAEILDRTKTAKRSRWVRFLFGSIGAFVGFWIVMILAFLLGSSPDVLDLILLTMASMVVALLSGAFVWCVLRRVSGHASALAAGAAIMPLSYLTVLCMALLFFD